MSKNGLGKLAAGIGLGVGLGMLFAPEKGEETRKKLKVKLDELIEKVKNIDVNEVKEDALAKIEEIKNDLKDLDKEKVAKLAKEKSDAILKKVDELSKTAKEKTTPYVEKAVDDVRKQAIKVTKSVLDKLEKESA